MSVLSPHTARPAQGRIGPFGSLPSSGPLGQDEQAQPWGPGTDFAMLQLERLAHACLHGTDAALVVIDGWRGAAHGLEDIYLHGIAPCARLLGHWWTCDTADFAQVTIASTNLQHVLLRLSQEFCSPGADHPIGLSVLLATEPQTQHTMGAFMLGEFFRRRGWSVQLLVPQESEEVLHRLRRDWFDALGVSVSSGRQLQVIKHLMQRLRAESPNPNLRLLLGGPLCQTQADALHALGADLVSGDARETVDSFSRQDFVQRN